MNLFIFAQQYQSRPNPIAVLLYLVIVFAIIASWWRIFTKGGQPGWGSLIPIYNLYLILKIVGRPWWFLLLLLIPVVNVIVAILITNDLSKSFGRGLPFTLGLIFLPFIFYPILAWSEATYQGPSASWQCRLCAKNKKTKALQPLSSTLSWLFPVVLCATKNPPAGKPYNLLTGPHKRVLVKLF
jgi:hypothetical protein